MSYMNAEAAYIRARESFKSPTLALLHGRFAHFVVASLSLLFSADRPVVAVADAHVEVEAFVEQLRAAGHDEDGRELPSGSGREICRYWVRVGWLVQQFNDDVEVYRLSAQAVSALEIAGRTGGGQSLVSRSRVRTLLDSVNLLTQNAQTDPGQRLASLRRQRSELDAEIARLEAGVFEPAGDDQLLEEAHNVLHLSRELPADFVRVAESIKAMQRDVVTELRRDVRPAGEVLRGYLHRGQHVMEATPEGRAFSGALKLIGDPERINQLTEQLNNLVVQPFANLLQPGQRDELSTIAKRVEQGVQEVLAAQRRASHVITSQVRTHDPVRDREVDDLLREAMAAMQGWVRESKGNAPVEPLRRFPTAGLGHLRQSLSDLQPPGSPEPLREVDGEPEFLDADTRAWGGPRYRELEEYLLGLDTGEFDLASAFAEVPDDARRPVDLLGLLEIAHRNGMTERETVSVVEARRPDGSVRRFAFGAVTAKAVKEETDE